MKTSKIIGFVLMAIMTLTLSVSMNAQADGLFNIKTTNSSGVLKDAAQAYVKTDGSVGFNLFAGSFSSIAESADDWAVDAFGFSLLGTGSISTSTSGTPQVWVPIK